jgi:hypothetical protein
MSYKTKVRCIVMIIEGANLAAVLIKHVTSISIVKSIVDISLLVAGIVVVVCTVYNQRFSLFQSESSVSQSECYRAT